MGERSLSARLKKSFLASAGDVVFGMEDGTVSIFGLVFGVAATTTDTKTVLIAGASGAVAAAVSMMAGTYLDAETARDEAHGAARRLDAEIATDAGAVLARVTDHLETSGLAPDKIAAIAALVRADPASLRSLAQAFENPGPSDGQVPAARALWMLVADFLAAAIPIVPFVLWPVPEARVVSAVVTLLLLVALGLGRALVGDRPVLRTLAETVAIGLAAALAGVAIGVAIARAFGA